MNQPKGLKPQTSFRFFSMVKFLIAGLTAIVMAGGSLLVASPAGATSVGAVVSVFGSATHGGTPTFSYLVLSGDVTGGTLDCRQTATGTTTTTVAYYTIGSFTLNPTTCSGLFSTGGAVVYQNSSPGDFVVRTLTPCGGTPICLGATPCSVYPTLCTGTPCRGTPICLGVTPCTLFTGLCTVTPCGGTPICLGATPCIFTPASCFSPPPPTQITVTVTGSQSFDTPTSRSFKATYSPTYLASQVSGTLNCTIPTGEGSFTSLTAKSYDLSACSGLSTSSTYVLHYVYPSGDFVVDPLKVTATVSGSEIFGTKTSRVMSAKFLPVLSIGTVRGTVTCTSPTIRKAFTALTAGSYELSTCSGLSTSSNYVLNYVYAAGDFVVTPMQVPVTKVKGTVTYGGAGLTFTGTYSKPRGSKGVTGAVTCTSVTGSKTPIASLPAGTYTIQASSCGGLVATTGNYTFTYASKTSGFVVKPKSVAVQKVSGSMSVGTAKSEVFTYTTSGMPIVISGLTCSAVTSSTAALSTLKAGSYTLNVKNCSAVTPVTGNYVLTFATKATGFKVNSPAVK